MSYSLEFFEFDNLSHRFDSELNNFLHIYVQDLSVKERLGWGQMK